MTMKRSIITVAAVLTLAFILAAGTAAAQEREASGSSTSALEQEMSGVSLVEGTVTRVRVDRIWIDGGEFIQNDQTRILDEKRRTVSDFKLKAGETAVRAAYTHPPGSGEADPPVLVQVRILPPQ
jgi:mevalonate pyrophosphate decarboxylase